MNDSTAGEPTDPDDRLVQITWSFFAKSLTIIVVHKKMSAVLDMRKLTSSVTRPAWQIQSNLQ